MFCPMYYKIIVLIIGTTIYEAHIEGTCGTYNKTTPC